MKTCTHCRRVLSYDKFPPHKDTKDGRGSWCRSCCAEQVRQRRSVDEAFRRRGQREEVKLYQKQYYENNKERLSKQGKDYAKINAEKISAYQAKWREENKESLDAYKRDYHLRTIDRFRPTKRESERNRMATRPEVKLSKYFAHRMRLSLKSGKGGRHWEDVVGYRVGDLRGHLESQFADGMSWENYGAWHVDHKLPVASFNFATVDDPDFKECWSLGNLQPLWAIDNMRKGSKVA